MALSETEKQYQREWYAKTKHRTRERRRLWSVKRRLEIKKQVYDNYGNKCALCGLEDLEVLSVDHIEGNGWADRKRGIVGTRLYYRIIAEGFPQDKYRLLCMNCNFKLGQRKIRKYGRPDLLKSA